MPDTNSSGAAVSPPLDIDGWVCPMPLRDAPNIVMGHGGGGAMSGELIEHLFLPAFGAAADTELGDSAVLPSAICDWRSPPIRSWSSRWCSPAARSVTSP